MDTKSINNHMAILIQIVRSIQLKKALSDINPDPELNFWRLIHGGFLDLAALEWCKIFGSNAENTHWKIVVEGDEGKTKFRDSLLKELGITSSEWDKNWHHLKNYRDELVAHHNSDTSVKKYPKLDIALKSSYFYYKYLDGLIENDSTDTIEAYGERFYKQSRKIGKQAVSATSIFSEQVY